MIPDLLKSLAQRRPVFHSEADFQHEFAWLARERLPDLEVRLEHPLPDLGNCAVDVLFRRASDVVAIELKYLCQQVNAIVGKDNFVLKKQGAQDVRRYDVLKDIERMEKFVRSDARATAAVVVLSNDPAYWTGPKKENTYDSDFALREGRVLSGTLGWSEKTGDGTKRGREKQIDLSGHYVASWNEYSLIAGRFGRFRFLSISIDQVTANGKRVLEAMVSGY